MLPHMTQTVERPAAPPTPSPQERVDAWLADFEHALATRDIERAVGKFAVDSFWRDLVSFTWNLKTLEGRDAIGEMLENRLAGTDPLRVPDPRDPDSGRGGDDRFIEFETAVGRGVGHLAPEGGG